MYRVSLYECEYVIAERYKEDFDELEIAKRYMQEYNLKSNEILICRKFTGQPTFGNFEKIEFVKTNGVKI